MPSLKVAWVSAMNSCSLISSRLWKFISVGIVASPTPTVPISSDSISLMSSRFPSTLAMPAAAIQPAVPPPTMTTRRTGRRWLGSRVVVVIVVSLAVHFFKCLGAQHARGLVVERRQHMAGVLGDMGGRALVGFEDVVAEDLLPGLALRRRQVAHGQEGQHQRAGRRVHV